MKYNFNYLFMENHTYPRITGSSYACRARFHAVYSQLSMYGEPYLPSDYRFVICLPSKGDKKLTSCYLVLQTDTHCAIDLSEFGQSELSGVYV